MQEKYTKEQAMKALRVFECFMKPKVKDEKLKGSNKALLFLTMIAYKGECSNHFIKKALPVVNTADALAILVESNLITITKNDYRNHTYTLNQDTLDFVNDELFTLEMNVTPRQLWLFANTLLNMARYIKEYKINAWNVLALILETTLHVDNELLLSLSVHDIKSIDTGEAPKYDARKKLETYGIIKAIKRNTAQPTFKLNRKAYLMEH